MVQTTMDLDIRFVRCWYDTPGGPVDDICLLGEKPEKTPDAVEPLTWEGMLQVIQELSPGRVRALKTVVNGEGRIRFKNPFRGDRLTTLDTSDDSMLAVWMCLREWEYGDMLRSER